MHRKAKRSAESTGLGLDSLMDILTCLVGLMLFLIMYTVLGIGSVAYEATVPLARALPLVSERVVVLAHGGTLRVLDLRSPLSQLLSGFEIVRTFEEVPIFVEGNARTPIDRHFRYSLRHTGRMSLDLRGTLDLVIDERTDAVGDSLHQFDQGGRFASILDDLDREHVWLSFAVDSASVDVFRRARELALEKGFVTRWDEFVLPFPVTIDLSADAEDWFDPRSSASKPLR